MYKILKANKDTYITNRVISGKRRTKGNVGGAGTLDLFKLYGVTASGSIPNTELSRLLIQFNLDPIRDLISSGKIDISNPSFQCKLLLKDVYGGQPTPTNFSVVVNPLSRSFDEGIGRDLVYYSDEDVCNFLTSSKTDGPWIVEGCGQGGTPGSSSDFIDSLSATKLFVTGEEDLDIDITTIISSTLAGDIPDKGFRIALSSSHESDTNTYFVKRFSSRTAHNQTRHPELIVKFDDSIQDDQQLLTFDNTFTLFLFNYSKGNIANLLSASTPVTGQNSLILKLSTEVSGGWYDTIFTGSQHKFGENNAVGIYSASVNLSSSDPTLAAKINASGSVNFVPIWGSLDGTVSFFTGSVISVQRYLASNANLGNTSYIITAQGIKPNINSNENINVRIHLFNKNSSLLKLVKKPIETPGIVVRNAFYSIRNVDTGDVIVPFDSVKNSTRLSSDAKGMWFNLDASNFAIDQRYIIDIKIITNGNETIYQDVSPIFRVS